MTLAGGAGGCEDGGIGGRVAVHVGCDSGGRVDSYRVGGTGSSAVHSRIINRVVIEVF